ncbi:hypothetical protein OKA05_29075 [Luteolibacter arcticus]|uniref:Uncharacterized protein n=1 Tax=Luteolibacter arcticus TaxID=1581411 RepID=A0ABT3GSY5_9BACT|nr:hypothetical protein [Luteolibacter arcticus]MCW1926641.1 hypothetical protein [Luteolibacter arcticus]
MMVRPWRLDPRRLGGYAEYLDFDCRGVVNIDRDLAEEFFPNGVVPPVYGEVNRRGLRDRRIGPAL